MSLVYRYNNYADWIASRQVSQSQNRSVAIANTTLYSGWCGLALSRGGAFVEAITAFFRTHAPLSLTTPVVLIGARQVCSHIGLALSCVVAITEMAVTGVVFGRDAHKYRTLGTHLDDHRANHGAYSKHIRKFKEAVGAGRAGRSQATSEDLEGDLKGERVLSAATASLAAPPKHDTVVLAKSFFEYEVGNAEIPEATSTFKRSLVMFLRDGPLQGGAVGCNLALLWQGFKISDLLHIVTVPINAVATAIGGAAFSAACGVFHIVGGALARSEGLQKLAAAVRAKDVIDNAIRTIEGIKAERNAEVEEAVAVGAALLQHAAKNEENAQDSARKQVFVGKWRIGYGTTAIAIAAGSLTFFLLAGGMSTGGLLFAVAGALFLAGWVAYAAYRNGKDASKLKDATTVGSGTTPAMTLEQTIERAVAYLDRTGGIGKDNRDGRRIIKHALRDIGMDRSDFWALRFCSADPAVKGPVIDTLKVLIHNHVDGDGARRALQQSPAAKKPAKDKATA